MKRSIQVTKLFMASVAFAALLLCTGYNLVAQTAAGNGSRNVSIGTTALYVKLLHASTQAIPATPPNLGTAATYGAFTGAGAIENTGLTVINGDIGTHVGAMTGFPPGIYTGARHVADAASLAAKNDLVLAYNSMNDAAHAIMFDTALVATMGNGQVLYPATYGRTDLTTISGNLTFDAMGNPSAVFVVKVRAALNIAKNTTFLLAGGAKAENIYWAVDGAISVLDNSVIKGTLVANGAIHLYGGSSLEGRALSIVGAVTFASNIVTVPGNGTIGNNLIVVKPAPGDSVQAGTLNYQIMWAGTGIAPTKILTYSLDSGLVWHMIDTITTPNFTYSWNVPDTISKTAMVRITDANNLVGTSGMFTIYRGSLAASIIVVRPAFGEVIDGGTQNYTIMYTQVNAKRTKTYEFSSDAGATWTLLGVSFDDSLKFNWASVPNVPTTRALIRITDSDSTVGTSGLFTIRVAIGDGSIDAISITGLDGNNSVGNSKPLGISWTFTPDIGPTVKVEYSLDNMVTWQLIVVKQTADQPNTMWITPAAGDYNPVYIRVSGTKGTSRISSPFAIKGIASVSTSTSRNGYVISSYPNPVSDQLNVVITSPSYGNAYVSMFDPIGRQVSATVVQTLEAGTHTVSINTVQLATGMYTYTVRVGAETLSGSVVVVR